MIQQPHQQELKAGFQRDICIPMFKAALFTKVNINMWIGKMWYIHINEIFSALKRKKIWQYATTWMNLKDIMLWKKGKYYMITLCHWICYYQGHLWPNTTGQFSALNLFGDVGKGFITTLRGGGGAEGKRCYWHPVGRGLGCS